ncbi:hypothetical protein CA984_42810, partial [Streptosporangium minutum]
VYLFEDLGAPQSVAALGFAVFSTAMTAGRFAGDGAEEDEEEGHGSAGVGGLPGRGVGHERPRGFSAQGRIQSWSVPVGGGWSLGGGPVCLGVCRPVLRWSCWWRGCGRRLGSCP